MMPIDTMLGAGTVVSKTSAITAFMNLLGKHMVSK